MASREANATLVAVLLVVGMAAGFTALGTVAADKHTKEDAEDFTAESNYTVNFPNPEDHYPGDQNEEGGSIQYWYAGEDAFEEMGAEDGAYIDYIIVDADWIDYSACDVDNTAAFGIDRGNDNEGTNYDEDLVQKQKETTFRDDGLTVEFYDHEDLGGDPPYMAPEDAIVAAQGEGSAGGPCLTVTDEPGWYQVQGFMNGTEADNGQGEEPSEDAETAGGTARANYLYVCECDSEEEAREELGPPPGKTQDGGGDVESGGGEAGGGEAEEDTEGEAESDEEAEETPESETDGESEGEAEDEETPEGESEDGAEDDEPAEEEPEGDTEGESEEEAENGTEEEAEATPEETEEPEEEQPEEEQPEEEPPAEDNETGADEAPGEDGATPTADDGPGFGPVVALVALVGAALLAYRRD